MLSAQQINAIRAFNRQYTQVWGVLNKRTFGTDLTWPEGRILIEIGVNHLNTPMKIANRLQLDRSYTSRLINKLVKKEIVVKTPSATDSRSVNLTLTADGRRLFNDVNQKSNELIQDLLQHLSPLEQEQYFNNIMEINRLLFKEGTRHEMAD